ncbi:hypothetical protein [Kitasatospora brasiliensis]|uniref:hypothetical protein n=1 Tax=Kitasatospora brasiliensis TaxID=3058040 RepID=UPI0029308EAB|nr:hypothetical protein [Kitasatospora sp. K002]
MSPDERPAIKGPLRGSEDLDLDGLEEEFAAWGTGGSFIFAPGGNINTGSVYGGQRVENGAPGAAPGSSERVEAQDGPISLLEVLAAQTGFAEPDCFAEGLSALGTRLLFLAGEPGTGRRTTAINLLSQSSGNSTALRALDSDSDLSIWRPTHREARGYLVHGLSPTARFGPTVVANLGARLEEADACMVVMLPHEPGTLRRLIRELDISPVRYTPPTPREVFDARLTAAVPEEERRRKLLDRLEADLDELLASELVPAQVAELVDRLSRTGDEGPDLADLGQRLSFLAETEVPDLLKDLREDPDALAFLLVTSVLEGLDHRIIRDETDRLLKLADGRLDAVVRTGADGEQGRTAPGEDGRPNPRFVFRRSLDELLKTIRAECLPTEMRETSGYTYTVEPLRFKRHRQAETVLRHVWRQYGEVSGLLTEWMDNVPGTEAELARPVGRVMGLAASWGGGRRALWHIHELARSDRAQSRSTAAYALGIVSQDPILAGEVKHRVNSWSSNGSWRLRSTVAAACGGDYGAARPEAAISLIRRCYRGEDGDEGAVAVTARWSLASLFAGGNQTAVFRQLMRWADRKGHDAELALTAVPELLLAPSWFQQQLGPDGEFGDAVITFIGRSLNSEGLFPRTSRRLLDWCHRATWDEPLRAPVETLLTALAQQMRTGELGLLTAIERSDDPDLVGRDIAHRALEAWRRGEPQPFRSTPTFGGHDDPRH